MTIGNVTIGLPKSIKIEELDHPMYKDHPDEIGPKYWVYSSPRGKIEVIDVKNCDEDEMTGKIRPCFSVACLEGDLFEGVVPVWCGEELENGMIRYLATEEEQKAHQEFWNKNRGITEQQMQEADEPLLLTDQTRETPQQQPRPRGCCQDSSS